MSPGDDPGPWWRRIAWFAAIWAAGVLVLGLVAMAIRTLLTPGG